jgi:hypothetical protein
MLTTQGAGVWAIGSGVLVHREGDVTVGERWIDGLTAARATG